MTSRTALICLAVVLIATGVVFEVIHYERDQQHRICESSRRVRAPLEKYIASEVLLVNEAKAQGIPLGPPALKSFQDRSFANLMALNKALSTAQAVGCTQ